MDLLFSTASTILGSPDSVQSATSPEPSLAYRRKRRITYEDLGHTVRDLHDNSDPRVTKFIRLLSRNVRSFCLKEFFYSTIDANYYNDNEFIACLGMLGLEHIKSMTRYEWSVVKGVMGVEIGRPRRFSAAFLDSERMKLRDYRQAKRQNKASSSISIGDTVTVCDVKTKTIARGLVISTVEASNKNKMKDEERNHNFERKESYLVQLERPELGIEIYDDVDIAVIESNGSMKFEEALMAQNGALNYVPNVVVDLSSLITFTQRPQGRRGSKGSLGKNEKNERNERNQKSSQSTDNSSETADSTHESSQSMDEDTENDNIDWSEMNSTQSSVQSNRGYVHPSYLRHNQVEEKKEETKELILKRCAMAVQEVWPDCLSEAKKYIEKELEKIITAEIENGIATGVTGGTVGVGGIGIGSEFLSDSKIKGLIVRCIGCLLLFRDTKGKWIPQYAEPVLVAVASGICEGCSVQDYRLMMSLLGDILSHI